MNQAISMPIAHRQQVQYQLPIPNLVIKNTTQGTRPKGTGKINPLVMAALEGQGPFPRYLTTRELGLVAGISHRTLERWRLEGKGPGYRKIEGLIRYPTDATLRYFESRAVLTTDDRS